MLASTLSSISSTSSAAVAVKRGSWEPSWHRRARAKRHRARRLLKLRSLHPALARRAIRHLAGHHGSWVPLKWTMPQWTCGCGYRNAAALSYCRRCNTYYEYTSWTVAQRSKSRQRSQTPRETKKERPEKKKDDVIPDFTKIALSDPPWTKTTPQRRLATPAPEAKTATSATSSGETPTSVRDQLSLLKDQYKDQLPVEFQTALDKLVNIKADGPVLTHSHLHKVKQAKALVDKAQGRLQLLDGQWANFVALIRTNFQKQLENYLQQRKEIQADLAKKRAKHIELQAEIQKLSTREEAEEISDAEPVNDLEVEEPAMPWDTMPNIDQMEQDENLEPGATGLKPALQPFRGADGQRAPKAPRPNP